MGRIVRRVVVTAAALAGAFSTAAAAGEAPAAPVVMRLFADTDDDDADGVADHGSTRLAESADTRWLEGNDPGLRLRSIEGEAIRVVADGRVFSAGDTLPQGPVQRVGFLGVRPGTARIDLGSKMIDVRVCKIAPYDPQGRAVDLATSHASISRTLPPALARAADATSEVDALSWRFVCPTGMVPDAVAFRSTRPDGATLDSTGDVRVRTMECEKGTEAGLGCGQTGPIRATADHVDRSHPTTARTSLRAAVGGRIEVRVEGRKATSIRVGGPRESTRGPVGRLRGRVRFHLARLAPGGAPPVGGNAAGAIVVSATELETVNALWGQCGIHFGSPAEVDLRSVDPPGAHMLAVGCDLGMPASGGALVFDVDGRRFEIATRAGELPVQVARRVALALETAGFVATVSVNARIQPGAARTADVLVQRRDGERAELGAEGPVSRDSSLEACIGRVDLNDGLRHFDDLNAVAGTVEERALVKALQDDDPTTIDVFVIPSFSRTGRIGESFIDADGSSIRNAIILDRAGIRAGPRSFALAHELGHILLDMPGHPDDFGVDRPWLLMDADAADPTIFGPRRLPVEDCERAFRQSGPASPIPLLAPWPLYGPETAP